MRRPEQTIDLGAERLSAKLAESTTRRSFLGRLGAAALAVAGGSAVAAAVKPDEAEALHFCGHIAHTGSCPSPYPPLSRVDRQGYPLHPKSSKRIDNLGRVVDSSGYALDAQGRRRRGPGGKLPPPSRASPALGRLGGSGWWRLSLPPCAGAGRDSEPPPRSSRSQQSPRRPR